MNSATHQSLQYSVSKNHQKTDSSLLARINMTRVLGIVRKSSPISRAELARITSLQPSTLTGIVSRLLDAGLLLEGSNSKLSKGGGRPSKQLLLNSSASKVLALDIEADHLRVALTDIAGSVLNYRHIAVDRHSDPKHTIATLLNMADEVSSASSPPEIVSVSCAGLLDEDNGIMISSTNMPKWKQVPLVQTLEQHFGIPVLMGRSLRMAAAAETWFHPNPAPQKMVVVTLRTGIGFSLVNNGEIYRGINGFEGELGHTFFHSSDKKHKRLEDFISPKAITGYAKKALEKEYGSTLKPLLSNKAEIDPESLYFYARGGDRASQEIVDTLTEYIAVGMANLVNMLNPDDLVLCGAIDIINERLLDKLKKNIKPLVLPQSWEGLNIRLSRHAEQSALLGAAAIGAEKILSIRTEAIGNSMS